MSEKMRLTAHNGRAGKDGVYSPKHNDRNYNTQLSENLHPERISDNRYWHCYQNAKKDMSFEDVEKTFYENHFSVYLEQKNATHMRSRHKERVKNMDDYRTARRTCPEEQIMQVGCKGNCVEPDVLMQVCFEQMRWEQKQFKNFRILDVALHVDEAGAPHIQRRGVWVAHDANGAECVSQSRALAEMGIQRPDQSRPVSRYNNAKMTYTRLCREHFLQVCHSHGLDIEVTPQDKSKTGLSLVEYQARQAQERLTKTQKQVTDNEWWIDEYEDRIKDLEPQIDAAEKRLSEYAGNIRMQETRLYALQEQITQEKQRLRNISEYANRINREISKAEANPAYKHFILHAYETPKKIDVAPPEQHRDSRSR